MKTLAIFIFICLAAGSYAQNKQFYSAALTGGAMIPLGTLGSKITNGYNIGLDLEVRNRGLAVYLNSKINFVKENSSTREFFFGFN